MHDLHAELGESAVQQGELLGRGVTHLDPAAGDGALWQRAAAVVDFVVGRRQDGSVVVFGVLVSDIWRIIGFFCCCAVVSTVTPFL